ncbi:MAG: type II secretion system F family protein [Phycisphaerae bacterium]|jgi:type IV pilus assembly protein PilC
MPSQLGTIYGNLACLIEAGVPIVRVFKTVAAGLKGKYRSIIEQMTLDVSSGQSIADSMANCHNVFSKLDITTIRASETAGMVDQAFKKLARWHEFQYRMKRSLINGMLMPVMLIHLAAILGPFPAYILGARNFGEYLLSAMLTLTTFYIPLAIIVFICKFTPEKGSARIVLDWITLRIPVLGAAVKALNIARFTRAFSMLSSAAVPPAQAAEQAVLATENYFVASWFAPMANSARNGNPLSEGLSPKNLDDYYFHSWLIGEETGSIDNVTNRLAEVYLEKAEELFSHFYTWLPRLIYFYAAIITIIGIFKGYGKILESTGAGF